MVKYIAPQYRMKPYSDRLNLAMRRASVDTHGLARHLGVSYQAVKKVMDGLSTFNSENNSKAAQFLGINTDWLATGVGDMLARDEWPFTLFSKDEFNSLSKEDRDSIEDFAYGKIGRHRQRMAA
jgi:hypothetical protein